MLEVVAEDSVEQADFLLHGGVRGALSQSRTNVRSFPARSPSSLKAPTLVP